MTASPLRPLPAHPASRRQPPPLIVTDLRCTYRSRVAGRSTTTAVDGVSLRVEPGERVGLVGESGSGKTTLARCIVRLTEPDSGSVRLGDTEYLGGSRHRLRALRRQIQFVFQDPFESLDPRWSVEDIVNEPLRPLGLSGREMALATAEALEAVDLGVGDLHRRARDFSGGERQRLAIARALVVRPAILLLDEPCASLDVSIQAKVINVLQQVQAEYGMSFLFITHDLSLVRQVSDRIAVMYGGRIVECAPSDALFTQASHPYTRRLLTSIPGWVDRHREIGAVSLNEEPAVTNSGCRYRLQCSRSEEQCAAAEPSLQGAPHQVRCHFPVADPLELVVAGSTASSPA
jgi:oligopeptide transport system ATP-binding protein